MESPFQQLQQEIINPVSDIFYQFWWVLALVVVIVVLLGIASRIVTTKRKKTQINSYKRQEQTCTYPKCHNSRNMDSLEYRHGEKLPYYQKNSILTNTELLFYKELVKAINDKATICLKVRLADFLEIPKKVNNRYLYMITNKHVDFLICDKINMSPICVIELDDASHDNPENKNRDDFKDATFDKANIKIHRVEVASSYNVEKMSSLLLPLIEEKQRYIEKNQRQDWSG